MADASGREFDRRKLNRFRDLANLSRSLSANSGRILRNLLLSKKLRRSASAYQNDTLAFGEVEKRGGYNPKDFDGQKA